MWTAFLALILMTAVGIPAVILYGLASVALLTLIHTVRGIRSLLVMLKMIGKS